MLASALDTKKFERGDEISASDYQSLWDAVVALDAADIEERLSALEARSQAYSCSMTVDDTRGDAIPVPDSGCEHWIAPGAAYSSGDSTLTVLQGVFSEEPVCAAVANPYSCRNCVVTVEPGQLAITVRTTVPPSESWPARFGLVCVGR